MMRQDLMLNSGAVEFAKLNSSLMLNNLYGVENNMRYEHPLRWTPLRV